MCIHDSVKETSVIEKRFDVLTTGELCPDLILSGDVVPTFGQVEKLVDNAVLTIGSSSGIFACAAARLGMRVASIGRVGDDEFGHFMLRSLQKHNVDISGIIIDKEIPTGFSVILDKGNDRAILTYPGTIPTLRLSDIRLEILAQARHLHLTCYYIQDALRPDVPELFDIAHKLGLTVSLDTNFDPAVVWNEGINEVLPRTDVFLPNDTECCAIAGNQDVEVALEILAQVVPIVAVKRGGKGALGRSRSQVGQVFHAQSLPVPVVDTVGAGDTFDAGFLYGYLSKWDLQRSLRLGAICGSLSTRKAGGTTSQPTFEEALQFLS
jgi:sugar/nucleoside kinase (ribokinase family)